MTTITAILAGDRVTFTDRHDGTTRAGILLTTSNPGEATVITAHFPGEHAIHVVCSCCGTLSTDTYAVEARDGGMGEMFVARWNANCRANAHAKYGEHPAARTGGA
jgi:hypothetical protein